MSSVAATGGQGITRRTSFNISLETAPQESVQERQEIINRKYIHIIAHLHNKTNIYRYASLQRLAKDRKQRLEESKKRFALSRETNELKHWISDKVNAYVKIKHILLFYR